MSMTEDCWLYAGIIMTNGYGRVFQKVGGKMISFAAHRLLYENERGEIPDGLYLDHLCRVRSCINPDHLEPVTHRENTLRSDITLASINRRKKECKHGHRFTPSNTYLEEGRWRRCRECMRIAKRVPPGE